MVARTTVQTYFDILVDTLVGYWIPAWRPKRSNRNYSQPKFYLFDTGVARALSGRLPYPPTKEESGPLFETMLFNEIRAYLSYEGLRYQPHYWRTYDGSEVDLLCETREGFVAIEMKSSAQWQARFNRGLVRIRSELAPARVDCYGVFAGDRAITTDEIDILPAEEFLRLLWQGRVFRRAGG
jgi:uncharacterized protein